MSEKRKHLLKTMKFFIKLNIALIIIYVPLIIIDAIIYKFFGINIYICIAACIACTITAVLNAKDLYKNLTAYQILKELPEEEIQKIGSDREQTEE